MVFNFTKKLSKTLEKGQVAIPTFCNDYMDDINVCRFSLAVELDYILSTGHILPGRLYRSANVNTPYYQSYIVGIANQKFFAEFIRCHNAINFNLDLSVMTLFVRPA